MKPKFNKKFKNNKKNKNFQSLDNLKITDLSILIGYFAIYISVIFAYFYIFGEDKSRLMGLVIDNSSVALLLISIFFPSILVFAILKWGLIEFWEKKQYISFVLSILAVIFITYTFFSFIYSSIIHRIITTGKDNSVFLFSYFPCAANITLQNDKNKTIKSIIYKIKNKVIYYSDLSNCKKNNMDIKILNERITDIMKECYPKIEAIPFSDNIKIKFYDK